jgi:hypothetical protein
MRRSSLGACFGASFSGLAALIHRHGSDSLAGVA